MYFFEPPSRRKILTRVVTFLQKCHHQVLSQLCCKNMTQHQENSTVLSKCGIISFSLGTSIVMSTLAHRVNTQNKQTKRQTKTYFDNWISVYLPTLSWSNRPGIAHIAKRWKHWQLCTPHEGSVDMTSMLCYSTLLRSDIVLR